ncbi:MAG: Crp/Fnr family transcriptional regulator [Bacteroidota bacterium]
MDNFQSFFNNIARYVTLSETEQKELSAIIKTKRVKRRQFIVQPDFVCQHRHYILKGAFRVYFLDDHGKEHTISIGVEDWFVSDFYSYITQTPATLYAEALEDSIILQMAYTDIEGLCKKTHALSEYFRLSTEKAFAFARRRVISNISKSAEER